MKTLKKTLCLVLALVMVVGTLAVAASADVITPADNFANYKDAEAAKASPYAKAIDINLGLGIIKGVSKTEIKIDGTLTRAMAAKIVCYLLVGENDAETLLEANDSFSDVPVNAWYAKYVAFASSDEVGILNGVGGGKFNPKGELTGFQFLKILINALGKGMTYEEVYVPQPDGTTKKENRPVNMLTGSNWKLKVAEFAKNLNLGLDGVDMNKPLTRAQAMALVLQAIEEGPLAYAVTEDEYGEDPYGRKLIVYRDAYDKDKKIISGDYSAAPLFTVTVLDDTNDTIDEIIAKYNADNKLEGDKALKKGFDETYDPGTVVELYVKDNVVTKTIRTTYLLDQITAVDKDTGKVTTKNGKFDGVVIKGAAKGDLFVVPYAFDTTEKYVVADAVKVEKADVASKKVASRNAKNITVDGKKYFADVNFVEVTEHPVANFGSLNFADEYDFYLSPAGTVLAIEKVTEAAPQYETLYAWTLALQSKAANSGSSDLFGVTSSSTAAQVVLQIVTPEGENKVVSLALDKDGKATAALKTFLSDMSVTGVVKSDDTIDTTSKIVLATKLVAYHETDKGVVVDKVLTTAQLSADTTKGALASFGGNLTSKTALKIVTLKDGKYTAQAFTGYKTFPAVAKDSYYAVITADGKAATVYVYGAVKTEVVPEPNVFTFVVSVGDQTAKGYTVSILEDGVAKTIYTETATTLEVGAIYTKLTRDDNGTVTAGTKATTEILVNAETVTGTDDAYFTYAGGTYEYPATVKVIDTTGKNLTAVAKDQKVTVVKVSDTAVQIYIVG